jgi:hypothetical protein
MQSVSPKLEQSLRNIINCTIDAMNNEWVENQKEIEEIPKADFISLIVSNLLANILDTQMQPNADWPWVKNKTDEIIELVGCNVRMFMHMMRNTESKEAN